MTAPDSSPLTSDPHSTIEAMLRPDLRGRTAYGAPQLDVPVALNTNENSYAVPPVVVAAILVQVGELDRYRGDDEAPARPEGEGPTTMVRELLRAYHDGVLA